MRRPAPRTVEDTCRDARRIVVIDGVVDTTNIGAIFRSAAALGMDAVLLTRNSCDPLNRPCGQGVHGFGLFGSLDVAGRHSQ